MPPSQRNNIANPYGVRASAPHIRPQDGKAKRINNRGLSAAKPPDTKTYTTDSSAKTSRVAK